MFAVLTNADHISVGTICNIRDTIKLNDDLTIDKKFKVNDSKNILLQINMQFQEINMLSLNDKMPFVTPFDYDKNTINKIISIL